VRTPEPGKKTKVEVVDLSGTKVKVKLLPIAPKKLFLRKANAWS